MDLSATMKFPSKWIVVDFETRSACDLKRAGSWRYSEHLSTEVLCLAWEKSDGHSGVWLPCQPYPFTGDEDAFFVAHNTGFEKAIWRHIMVPVFGWPDVSNGRWHDTMATCAMRSIPQELDAAARVLSLRHQKDLDGKKLTLGLSKIGKEGFFPHVSIDILQRVGEYCLADSRSEAALYQRLGPLPHSEWLAWQLDQRINERGVAVDLDFVVAARRVAADAMWPFEAEFAEITGGLKGGQRDRFLDWLFINGLNIPNLTKETLAPIMEQIEDDDDNLPGPVPDRLLDVAEPVARALALRSLAQHSSLKKLDRLVDCVGSDGRVHGCLNYHAASPGRWGGRLFQPQNFPRGTIDKRTFSPDVIRAAIKTGDHEHVRRIIGEPVETVVSSLRYALVPGRGRVFLSGDYAGIQARTVLALAGQHDKTDLMANGADIYLDMASQIYRRTVGKHETEERQTGKNSVLGLGFQMGSSKFQWKYARKHPIEFCEHVVHTYRHEWAPNVRWMWYGFQDAAIATVRTRRPHESHNVEFRMQDDCLTVRVPTGGVIWYPYPHVEPRKFAYAGMTGMIRETDKEKEHYVVEVSGERNGHWCTDYVLFGGRLTQNVVTRIEVDMIVKAGILCEKNGFPIVLTVHDELIAEPLEQDADEKAFKQIMLDVDQAVNKIGIPVNVETWAGNCYRK